MTASDSVELSGTGPNGQGNSGLFAQADGVGEAGEVLIKTGQLIVRNGALVTVSSQGLGDAGNVGVAARFILLDNRGTITAESASGLGKGGNVRLQAEDLLLMRRNSQISVTAGPTAASGNIDISTESLIASENSDFILNLKGRSGGDLRITTKVFFFSPDSDIIVSSGVEFEPGDTFLDVERILLPGNVVDITGLIATGCAAAGENEFTITGRGGVPPSPNEVLSSDAVWVDWGTLKPRVENSSRRPVSTNPTATEPAPIVEARGWGD